jgi:amino acid efflux transporter
MAALILVVTLMNMGGVQVSGRLQLWLAALLVTLLVIATVTALPHARLANLHPFAPHGWFAIVPAAAVLVWGFAGWEAVTSLAADFRRPERDLPKATAIAIIVVGVLYLAIAATSFLVLGPKTGATEAPLSELLAIGVGGPVRVITAAIAILLTLGAMNAYFAGAAKLGAALGRDGALPVWFARGSEVGQVPRRSLMVVAALASVALGIFAVTGAGARASVLLTTGSFVLVYILGTAAAIKLLPRASWPRRAAIVAFGSVVVLLFITGLYVLFTLVVAGAALLYNRRHQRQSTAAALSASAAAAPSASAAVSATDAGADAEPSPAEALVADMVAVEVGAAVQRHTCSETGMS